MMKLKKLTLQLLAGANIATAILMLLVGMSDRVNPTSHPVIACVGLAFPAFIVINALFLIFFLIVKWRYVIVPFLGFVVCYPSMRVYCPLNTGSTPPEGSLKVMSYNICNFDSVKGSTDEVNPIMRYITESGADIVCLQEARIDDMVRNAIKDHYQYCDSVKSRNNTAAIVLISKYPITSKRRIDYEAEGNVSAAFEVNIDGQTVNVIGNHFESTGLSQADRTGFNDMVKGNTESTVAKQESRNLLTKLGASAARRAPQVEAVAAYAKRCYNPVILCGDFNDNPISYTRHTLAQVLTDCYVETGNGPGFSFHSNSMHVRIDNLMCSKQFTPYACKVDSRTKYSDHYPISCWLKMNHKVKKQQ